MQLNDILHRLLRCFAFQSHIQNRWAMQRSKILIQEALQTVIRYAENYVILLTSRLRQSPAYSLLFSARCNIYISRLCYDVSVRLSVCL